MSNTQIRSNQVRDQDLTFDDIGDGAVRGATSNAGTQRELATGTVSTVDIRDDAINAAKLLETDTYTVANVLNGDGTVGAPSYSFSSDTNMGIYRIGADILGFSTTGTERVRINAVGEVAIGGATVTNAILALQSTTKAFIPPRMTTTERDAITSPTAGMTIYNTTTNALNIYNGSTWGTPSVTETDPLSIHLNGDNSPSTNISWGQNQITNLVIHVTASDPGSPVEGQIWYNSTQKQWKGRTNTTTVILG